MTVTQQTLREPRPSQRADSLGISGIRKIFERAQSIPDVIRLEFGEPDFQTPSNIRQAALKAIEQGKTKYTPGAGMLELRKAISSKLSRENALEYEAGEIVVAAGATAALNIALLAALDPGDEILVPNPGWATYVYAVQLVGGVPVGYSLKRSQDYRIERDNIERLISPRTKAILVNSPSNPCGSVMSSAELKTVSELALDHRLTVISDEVYEKFVYDGDPSSSIATFPGMKERTIIVNSFSKTYAMTGWRVGYTASNHLLSDAMAKVNTAATSCVSQICQIAALEALNGPQDSVDNMIAVYKERRSVIVKRLNEIKGFDCPIPRGAFYAFPSVAGEDINSFDLCMKILEQAHVATVPGSAFGSEGEGSIRLSYANSKEKIVEGLERISKLF